MRPKSWYSTFGKAIFFLNFGAKIIELRIKNGVLKYLPKSINIYLPVENSEKEPTFERKIDSNIDKISNND